MNQMEFGKEFLALAVVFNEDTGAESFDVKRDIYWRIFRAWPLARFQSAAAAWIRRGRFFPKPVELIELGRQLVLDSQPCPVPLPRQEETPEDRHARETAMAAMREFIESDPSPTRKGRC